MKRLAIMALAAVVVATGCRKIEVDDTDNDNGGNGGGNGGGENLTLSGRISADRTLKTGNTYLLKGIVYVVEGAKLTIEPGVTIKGERSSRGTLVVTRGTQIIAEGTADKPIVFTNETATPQSGFWGGLVILGRAKTNNSFNGVQGIGEIEGGVNNAEGLGLYGGADDEDNSGVLKYVRIEYAGYAFLPDKELNGLTLGGVGRGTVIDYVQVSFANDDSFEWFGGTVNAKHLIAYKGLDDDFDADNGFNGKVQFAIGFRDSTLADISSSNGFEMDNDAGGSSLKPQTSPIFSNVTLIGPRASLTNIGNSNYRRGMHLRRNSSVSVYNSVVMGWPTGLHLDAGTGTPTDTNIIAGRMVLANNIFAGNNTQLNYVPSISAPTGWTTPSLTEYINRADGGNTVLATTDEVGLTAPFKYDSSVDFNATGGAAAAAGGSFTDAKLADPFFEQTTFRGAAGVGDTWWKGWTRFN
jgi:hypothetical protein